MFCFFFFFQAEDGIRDLVRSRGLGDVYKRQGEAGRNRHAGAHGVQRSLARTVAAAMDDRRERTAAGTVALSRCLLYTSDAADERSSVDLGGRRIIKKKKQSHKPAER